MKSRPKRQRYRRLVGPVELPMSDVELLVDAERAVRASERRGDRVVGRPHTEASDLVAEHPKG